MMKAEFFFILLAGFLLIKIPLFAQESPYLLNEPIDISKDFRDFTNTYYLADSLAQFDPMTGAGQVEFKRYEYQTRQAFDNMLAILAPVHANEFPTTEYAASPVLPFNISFISSRTIRIRMSSGAPLSSPDDSLMFVNQTVPADHSWKYDLMNNGYKFTSAYGSVIVEKFPWHIRIYDHQGKLLLGTNHYSDNTGVTFTPVLPFSYVRRASDYSRSWSAVWSLSPGEKIFGCGESFTPFDKRGQKVVLWTDDANGVQNEGMYKPVPFFMSSRGYGMFMHTSTPITCDFGKYYSGISSLMIGDNELDLFIFIGDPKEVLNEYTNLTGKASMPPLWSFGLWMSRITYFSEQDGRDVAAKLRRYQVPCDVIHFDTGWFGTDWRCDYQFASGRFKDPVKMITDLKKEGFHISLWQLPYFTPQNSLFPEIVSKGLEVKDGKGGIPYEDAILDFSNPETVRWYQDKIASLMKMAVGAIKVDFGEAAPHTGIYYSGRTGFYEHNLYPLRYNKAVADITRKITGDNIIWARSTWAGSQRYPVHWGGDPANTNSAMASTLRGGLSLGLSGFSFWSHDLGGFVSRPPEDLYLRWTAFGMLSSHTRAHGAPPKEPWEYSKEFLDGFRAADDMRYELMPYIYAQARDCTEKGLPMVRALFVEYPDDPGAWDADDQYLFGQDMLVAPLFENVTERNVYLPGTGKWIDYQTGKIYDHGWNRITSGKIPVVILVREGAVIPQITLVQSTLDMDWTKLFLEVFNEDNLAAEGLVCLPSDNILKKVKVNYASGKYSLAGDPFNGKIQWEIERFTGDHK